MQNFYQLLSIEPSATPEEIKRAFRSEIARYHPDKVQHLGKEFQDMAASRAAALTEAYRTLMNAELRAEYDRAHLGGAVPPLPPPAPQPEPQAATPSAPPRPVAETRAPAAAGATAASPRFATEQRDRDDFVRKATLNRFRQALSAEVGQVEELPARGFDLDFASKTRKLFFRDGGQRFAAKIVATVDRVAVQDVWSAAQKATTPICVFLMGSRLAPVKELAEAIADLKKRANGRGAISVIPVDVRDWSAHIPADAPASCKNLLKRLREASV